MRRSIGGAALALLMAALAWTANPSQARPRGDSGVRDASGGSTSAQTEQTIAVDPIHPNNILIGSLGGLSVSHDGGKTWKLGSPSCSGDNNPMFDRRGVAYFECDSNGVTLYQSDDSGRSWNASTNPVTDVDNQGDFVDRPWLVRAPRDGRLILGWESFFTNPVGWVFLKSSYDGGRTWSKAHQVDDLQASPAEQDPREMPVVGADGSIYVVYASGHNPFPAGQVLQTSLVVARSHDDGATFQRAVAAANIVRSKAPTEEAEAISSLAADPSARRAKHLALAWADQRSGESRIVVVTSVDGGVHWSAPADIAGDPRGLANQHDHPQIAFAPDGRLIVVWRDRRASDGSWSSPYQLFARALTVTGHGPVARGRVVRVTDKPQQPNSQSMFDEYLGIAVGPEGLSVAWNQLHNGVAGSVYRRLPLSVF